MNHRNISVQKGEIGRVVLSNWINRITPLIRYEMTDYVVCSEIGPDKQTILGFAGRTFDNLPVVTNAGEITSIPSYCLTKVAFPGMDNYQFISHSPTYFEVLYSGKENLDERVAASVTSLLEEWNANHSVFTIKHVDLIKNDAKSYKQKFVQKIGDPQIGFSASILSSSASNAPIPIIPAALEHLPFSRQNLNYSIPALFEGIAACYPNKVSLVDHQRTWTYEELNQQANWIAGIIHQQIANYNAPIALLFQHSGEMIIAILAVLKAGRCYLPLDPNYPAARINHILAETGSCFLLTDSLTYPKLQDLCLPEGQLLVVNKAVNPLPAPNINLKIATDAWACIIFTSGSTGKPKGVILDHQAVIHRAMTYINDYGFGPEDRVALLQSYVFNASIREIFACLLTGASLHIYSLKVFGVHRLAQWLEESKISTLYMVPTTFRAFLSTLTHPIYAPLRFLRLGGETVLPRDVEGFQQFFPQTTSLANALASTETGTVCQYFFDHYSEIPSSFVPSGEAVSDKELHIIGEDAKEMQAGITGELVVESKYFGPGYFNKGETIPSAHTNRMIHTGDLAYKTSTGSLVLTGRVDWQVKLRGHRINLLEIEQSLLSIFTISEVVVSLEKDSQGTSYLIAFVKIRKNEVISEKEIRDHLCGQLPDIMIPKSIIFVDDLPRTITGKVDRAAMDDIWLTSHKDVWPTLPPAQGQLSTTEQALASIWAEILNIDIDSGNQIRSEDRFFDIGGDSLLAAAMVDRIERKFQRQLPLAVLIQYKTLHELAEFLSIPKQEDGKRSLIPISTVGDQFPLFFIPGIGGELLGLRELAENLDHDHPLFGFQGGGFGESVRSVIAIEDIAAGYAQSILSICQDGPYIIIGYSFGGHLAIETARQISTERHAQKILVLLIDTYPPVKPHSANFFIRILIHLNNIKNLRSLAETKAYLNARFNQINLGLLRTKRIRRIAQTMLEKGSTPTVKAQVSLREYRPNPYPGDVILFEASQREWYVTWDPMDAWPKFITGKIFTYPITGKHDSLIKNPHAIELARQIKSAIYDHLPSGEVRIPDVNGTVSP